MRGRAGALHQCGGWPSRRRSRYAKFASARRAVSNDRVIDRPPLLHLRNRRDRSPSQAAATLEWWPPHPLTATPSTASPKWIASLIGRARAQVSQVSSRHHRHRGGPLFPSGRRSNALLLCRDRCPLRRRSRACRFRFPKLRRGAPGGGAGRWSLLRLSSSLVCWVLAGFSTRGGAMGRSSGLTSPSQLRREVLTCGCSSVLTPVRALIPIVLTRRR